MRKIVFLCEGKNDLFLLKHFLNQFSERELSISQDRLNFYRQDESDNWIGIRNQETNLLRRFLERSSPYEILTKAEGGKPKVIKVFIHFRRHLTKHPCKTILLLDLDHEDFNSFMSELKERINSTSQGKLDTRCDPIQQNDYIITSKTSVMVEGNPKPIGRFYIAALKPSLERLAGLADSDDDAIKLKKIGSLLNNQDLVNPLKELLQPQS